MNNPIFGMRLIKTPYTNKIREGIPHGQPRYSEYSPTKAENLILKLAFGRFRQQEIELHLFPVDMAIVVHYRILSTATVHGMEDMQYSYWFHVNRSSSLNHDAPYTAF